ncbi:DNase I-like protein, partial [Trametopsis cervina]
KTYSHLRLGTLNMRGHGSDAPNHAGNKWSHVRHLMRQKHIGILALQETHLDHDRLERLNTVYKNKLTIINSPNPDRPNAHGVGIVINREILPADGVKSWELIPGRAIMSAVPWHNQNIIHVLAVYAPNDPVENAAFWTEIQDALEDNHLHKPDILLGDCNIVDDKIDRYPRHTDHADATASLHHLCDEMELQDGWRNSHPEHIAYSYYQRATGSRSRIDRIYITTDLFATATDWQIGGSGGVETDHLLVTVNVNSPAMPYIGPGRWPMPLNLLKDAEITQYLHNRGRALERDITTSKLNRTADVNPQTLYHTFKNELIRTLRKRARIAIPKTEAKIRNLQAQLDLLQGPLDETAPREQNETQMLTAALLQHRIQELELERALRAETAAAARYQIEGETISKYWSQ